MNPIEFDPEAIRSLANILRDTGLTEIEIVSADQRLRLVRSAAPVQPAPAPLASAAIQVVPTAAADAGPPDDTPPEGAVPSPMVGIAYLSPDPASPPFITPGQAVTAGQTVMLIEAMKTFNQIKAPHAGTVTRILVTNGQPVEYGQPLLVIE